MYFHIVSSLEKAIGMPLNETSTGKSKEVNLCQKLFFLQTWGEYVVYKNC